MVSNDSACGVSALDPRLACLLCHLFAVALSENCARYVFHQGFSRCRARLRYFFLYVLNMAISFWCIDQRVLAHSSHHLHRAGPRLVADSESSGILAAC